MVKPRRSIILRRRSITITLRLPKMIIIKTIRRGCRRPSMSMVTNKSIVRRLFCNRCTTRRTIWDSKKTHPRLNRQRKEVKLQQVVLKWRTISKTKWVYANLLSRIGKNRTKLKIVIILIQGHKILCIRFPKSHQVKMSKI